jgi:hypothetical protein
MNFFSFINSFKFQANLNAYFTLIIVFQFQSQIIDANMSLLGRLKNIKKISTTSPLPTPPKNLIKRSASHLDPYLYLSKFGYLNSDDINSSENVSPKKSQRLMMLPNVNVTSDDFARVEMAIRKFQQKTHLNVTGKLDNDTLRMMRVPRCGHPDFSNASRHQRKRRYALQGSKWSKSRLSFRVGKYPVQSTMSRNLIDQELKRAFDLWSDAADVEFDLVSDGANFRKMLLFNEKNGIDEAYNNKQKPFVPPDVDIEVRFETGYHGDSEPFDGSGLILGHAYFPEFGGSTHFDAEEFWTSRSHDGVNLYQVAVHEFGHALGLEHSENFDAIMAPFFRYHLL